MYDVMLSWVFHMFTKRKEQIIIEISTWPKVILKTCSFPIIFPWALQLSIYTILQWAVEVWYRQSIKPANTGRVSILPLQTLSRGRLQESRGGTWHVTSEWRGVTRPLCCCWPPVVRTRPGWGWAVRAGDHEAAHCAPTRASTHPQLWSILGSSVGGDTAAWRSLHSQGRGRHGMRGLGAAIAAVVAAAVGTAGDSVLARLAIHEHFSQVEASSRLQISKYILHSYLVVAVQW